MTTKEKPKATTNIRARKVLNKLLENTGISISKAMREAGYGEGYAKNPQDLTRSKTWQDLLDEYLPDDLIAEKHKALLEKKEQIAVWNGKAKEVVVTNEIDANAVKAGVDMAYKIKGRYAPEKIEHTITAIKVINYGANTSD